MFIKKIILHKFKRFSLKEVETFELDTSDLSLVIFKWGNGVGKSSLLQQLNPLPAELKKDFLVDGFKEIHIEHLGKNYKLISRNGIHNFIEDNVELNTGGTKKAQLELVEEKFKLNPHVLSVVNGYTRFTIMSPSERKHWLTKISSVDYTYVIGIYNRLLEFKRDNSGTIKSSKDTLALIEKELIDIGDIKSVVEEQERIKVVIEDLLKSYIHTKDTNEFDQVISVLKTKLEAMNSNSIYSNRTNIEGVDVNSLEIKKNKLIERSSSLSKQEEQIKKYLSLFDGKIQTEEIDRLKTKVTELSKKTSKLRVFLDKYIKPDVLLRRSLYTIDDITSKYEQVNTHSYTVEELKLNTTVLIEENSKNLGRLSAILERVDETYGFLDKSIIKSVKCDTCGNDVKMSSIKDDLSTNIGSIKDEIDKTKKKLDKLNGIKKVQESLKYLKDKLDTLQDLDVLIEVLNTYSGKTFTVSDFRLDNLKIIRDICNSTLNTIRDIELPSYEELESCNKILKEEEVRMNTLKSIGLEKLEPFKKELSKLQEERIEIDKSLVKLKEFYQSFIEFNTILNDIKALLSKYRKLQCDSKKLLNNKAIELMVSDLKVKLSELSKLTDKRKELEVKVKMLNSMIIEKQDNNHILDILLKILSPTKGLIAKSVNSFIGKILYDMNLIINSVWSYNMKLLPCEVSETSDLDYKIKVEVNDSFIIEDISKLSSSMQEIVDLAFRLVFIKYMDFHTIPIILDEFGRTMDQEHRIQAFNMIDEVLCKTYEQVFLVSHFEEMYGRFKNASFPEIENPDTRED